MDFKGIFKSSDAVLYQGIDHVYIHLYIFTMRLCTCGIQCRFLMVLKRTLKSNISISCCFNFNTSSLIEHNTNYRASIVNSYWIVTVCSLASKRTIKSNNRRISSNCFQTALIQIDGHILNHIFTCLLSENSHFKQQKRKFIFLNT